MEAGAQGEHKVARGYAPVETHAAYWFADEGFRDAVAAYLERESEAVRGDIEYLGEFTPFKRGGRDEVGCPSRRSRCDGGGADRQRATCVAHGIDARLPDEAFLSVHPEIGFSAQGGHRIEVREGQHRCGRRSSSTSARRRTSGTTVRPRAAFCP